MSDRTFWDSDYSQGWINDEPVVLVRGGGTYGDSFVYREDLPWRVYAVVKPGHVKSGIDTARQIAALLNKADQ